MRNKKVIIIMIASLFVLSGILLGTQSINAQTGSVNKTSANNDLAVSNINLGANITLSNVYINNSYYTDYLLGDTIRYHHSLDPDRNQNCQNSCKNHKIAHLHPKDSN